MKKLLILTTAFALTLNLCGCIAVIDQGETLPHPPKETTAPVETRSPDTTAPEETTAPQETAGTTFNLPSAAISLPSTSEYRYAEDDTYLFSYTYQNPILYLEDTAVSQAVVLDLLNQIDSSAQQADRIATQAAADYAKEPDAFSAYFADVNYRVKRLDPSILSLEGSHVTYAGGIHPDHISKSVTYDLLTGRRLALQDILTETYSVDTLCTLTLDALAPMSQELYSDYSVIVKELFNGSWLDLEEWYLSDNGLCLYFAPYDIAPYATGTVTAEIPYEKLIGTLQDAYFPPEDIPSQGQIHTELFTPTAAEGFNRFHEVILEPEGEKILLHTDGTVSDVIIRQGTWNEDGIYFYSDATVFAANFMNSDDAIFLQTYIPDTMPNLQLQYISAGQQVTVYISQSGEDGSILLLEGA